LIHGTSAAHVDTLWLGELKANVRSDRERIAHLAEESVWIVFGQIMSVIGALTLARVMTEYLAVCHEGDGSGRFQAMLHL